MTSFDAAVRELREDGFAVLPDAVDPAHIACLREKMLADLPLLLARRDAPFNFNTGNIQQEPPPYPPYLFRDILLNDQAIAVTRVLLGPGLKMGITAATRPCRAAGPASRFILIMDNYGRIWTRPRRRLLLSSMCRLWT